MEQQQHPSAAVSAAAATNIAAAVTASAIASLLPANAINGSIPVARVVKVQYGPVVPSAVVAVPATSTQSQQQSVAMPAEIERHTHADAGMGRDPMLVAFEGHMLRCLKASSDVCLIDNVLHFDVNQCAYIIEGCTTPEHKRATRRRVVVFNISHVMRKVPHCDKGQLFCLLYFPMTMRKHPNYDSGTDRQTPKFWAPN